MSRVKITINAESHDLILAVRAAGRLLRTGDVSGLYSYGEGAAAKDFLVRRTKAGVIVSQLAAEAQS